MHYHRGVTITEVVIVLFIVALIAAFVLPILHRSRCGAASLIDKTQISQIHKALIVDSSSRNGMYATPGLIQPLRGPSSGTDAATIQDYSLNHSASLYSYMVMSRLLMPETLVSNWECGCEVTRGVSVKDDYDFNAYQPIANRFWDSTFLMRIDDPKIGAHCSFANLALCGLRRQNQWRDSQNAGVACFGTRGTRNGATSGDDYTKSPTLRMHVPKNQWNGHVVFNDNHTETLDSFFSPLASYDQDKAGKPVKDNIYAAEFSSPNGNQSADDNFLCVSISSTEYTVNDVYDPLDK